MEQIGLTHGGERAQVQSVLLLTDGLANQGISSKEGILAEMKKMQDQGLDAVIIPQDSPYGPKRPPQKKGSGLHLLFAKKNRKPQPVQHQLQPAKDVQVAVQQQTGPTPTPAPPVQQQAAAADDPPQAVGGATDASTPIPPGAKVCQKKQPLHIEWMHMFSPVFSLGVLCTHLVLGQTMMLLYWRPSPPREAVFITTLTVTRRYFGAIIIMVVK